MYKTTEESTWRHFHCALKHSLNTFIGITVSNTIVRSFPNFKFVFRKMLIRLSDSCTQIYSYTNFSFWILNLYFTSYFSINISCVL